MVATITNKKHQVLMGKGAVCACNTDT